MKFGEHRGLQIRVFGPQHRETPAGLSTEGHPGLLLLQRRRPRRNRIFEPIIFGELTSRTAADAPPNSLRHVHRRGLPEETHDEPL